MNIFGMKIRTNSVSLGNNITVQSVRAPEGTNFANVASINLADKTKSFTAQYNTNFIKYGSPIVQTTDLIKSNPIFIRPKEILDSKGLPSDSLELNNFSITENGFDLTITNGISGMRPEILAAIDYKNVYRSGKQELNQIGNYLYGVYQLRQLQKNIVENFVSYCKNNRTLNLSLENLQRAQLQNINDISSDLSFLNSNVNQVNDLQEAFEVKTLPNSLFVDGMLNFKDFFEQRMYYNNESFDLFSDTKVILQTIFDARSMMESYSLALLNDTDSDRGSRDTNPVKLDKTYRDAGTVTFTLSGLSGKKAFKENNLKNLLSSLPKENVDKVKLLIAALSKELRVSKGLSKKNVRDKLINFFGATADGNPFDNLFGNVGEDIFTVPEGTNSLSSLFCYKEQNATILPFEKKIVDDGQTTYIPGIVYFSDNILSLNGAGKFHLQPLENYSQLFSDVVANVNGVIEDLFEYNKQTNGLLNANLLQLFLNGLKNSIKNGTTDQAIVLAIWQLSASDFKLKTMLTQYLTLVGCALNSGTDERKLFSRVANEINEVQNISYAPIDSGNSSIKASDGMRVLYPIISNFAENIENYVLNLVSPKTLVGNIGNAASSTNFRAAQNVVSNDELIDKITQKTFTTGKIKDVLLTCATASKISTPNMFSELFSILYTVDNEASIVGNDRSYILGNDVTTSTDATATRFNQLTSSMIVVFGFEIMCAISNILFDCKLKQTATFSDPFVTINESKNAASIAAIDDIVTAIVGSQKKASSVSKVSKNSSISSFSNGSSNAIKSETKSDGVEQLLNKAFGSLINQTNAMSANNAITNNIKTLSSMINRNGYSKNKSLLGNSKIASTGMSINNFESTGEANRAAIGASLVGTELGSMFAKAFPDTIADIETKIIKNPKFMLKFAGLKGSLNQIKDKLEQEDKTIQNLSYLFNALANRLTAKKNQTLQYFKAIEQDPKRSLLAKNSSDLVRSKQLRVSNWLYSRVRDSLNNTTSFSADQLYSLLSLAKEEMFSKTLSDKRIKLLVVGVPENMTKYILDRVDATDIDSNFEKEKQYDLITINVYKKSSEDDDIVFYPQKFLFDMSLFPKEIENINVNPNTSFDQLLLQFGLLDLANVNAQTNSGRTVGLIDLYAGAYAQLNQDEQRLLFRNHVTSDLLQMYVKLLTNLEFSEASFTKSNENLTGTSTSDVALTTLLRQFLVEKYGVNTPNDLDLTNVQTLKSLQIENSAKEQLKVIIDTLKGKHDSHATIIAKKKFDRVFVIPIDIDSFVVNEEMTKETNSGKSALQSGAVDNYKKTNDSNALLYKDRSNEPNALLLEEYFVTIETVKK